MASYLPQTDSGLLAWATNFSTQISAAATTYGLTVEQVAAYSVLVEDYNTALTAATDPSTRGGSTVQAKNLARQALIAESRTLAMAVTNHPGVTDQQRYDLGLTVRDKQPTPVPPPTESPVLEIDSREGTIVTIRLHDGSSTRRGKPDGVIGASVFSYVGATAPVDIDDWKFQGNTTKTLVNVEFPVTTTPGTTVWLTAFWYNRRAESGPGCAPVSAIIAGGQMSEAA